MEKKNVKRNLLDHSEIKVRLLREYLKRYLNIITNDGYTERIKIYDLFCGEGVYDNGGEGSPLVILRAIKDIHFINVAKLGKVPFIDCYFNDINGGKVDKVKKAINEKSLYYSRFGELEFSSEDYQEKLKKLKGILSSLKKQKAFIFIDPYEYKHIKASDIKELLKTKNSEVLLFLPTQFMYRFHTNGTPEALKDFIEELTEYKNWKETDSVWSFIDQLKTAFRNYLGDNSFVDTFTIKKDSSTVYCLFFFSPHIKGFEKMLEAKWEIDTEQGKGWNYSGNEPSLFFDQKINPLEQKLKDFLGLRNRYNGEIYEFTLRLGFLPKHANEVFYNWQANNQIDVLTITDEKVRKRAFYISYNYYKGEPKEIKIILK